MYSQSEGRIISRNEIDLGGSNDSEGPDNETELVRHLAAIFGPVPSFISPESHLVAPALHQEEKLETAYDFRLFSGAGAGISTITVSQSDEIAYNETSGGFLSAHRPLSSYIAAPASDELRRQLIDIAVEGETVYSWSKLRSFAWERPWRVQVINVGTKPHAVQVSKGQSPSNIVPGEKCSKRQRPGKKSRIALRKRVRACELIQIADRAKRVRRNREKKLKRKIKAKASKAQLLEDASLPNINATTINSTVSPSTTVATSR
ncbi:hypothetical protein BGHDH14_bgh05001 [Blumeria hordei DH14]|uniref:Uncharacterized protein n=1 Tax=Blumeria graminis f. sp. hordei (strain DH14) TaxID=546991 RepID=N1JQI8_BLUG1|nr:hypothetical protein BGHDH14_bgh05001 [Blumeria hordei DH14]